MPLEPILALPGALLVAAAVSDMRRRIIPDLLSLSLAASGLVWSALTGGEALLAAGLSGAAAFAVGLALFAMGWLGGGDVKLAAATVTWLPAPALPDFVLVTSLTGAALGLALFAFAFGSARRGGADAVAALRSARGATVPYGAAIAAGGLAALASG